MSTIFAITRAIDNAARVEPGGIRSAFEQGRLRPEGPVAQWLEQPAHNRMVPGSSPGGPTTPPHAPERRPRPKRALRALKNGALGPSALCARSKTEPSAQARSARAQKQKSPFLAEWALGSVSVRSVWSRTVTQGRMGPRLRPEEPVLRLSQRIKSTMIPEACRPSCESRRVRKASAGGLDRRPLRARSCQGTRRVVPSIIARASRSGWIWM